MEDLLAFRMRLDLLSWLLCELSTDEADLVAFFASLSGSDDDAQAFHQALAHTRPDSFKGPLRAIYQDGKQLLAPREVLRALNIPRAFLYGLVERGTFPRPVTVDDQWIGWPRDLVLEWAETLERQRSASCPHSGYAPFERC
jgi:predicted DNA-binding transcriptional regulator AlpA